MNTDVSIKEIRKIQQELNMKNSIYSYLLLFIISILFFALDFNHYEFFLFSGVSFSEIKIFTLIVSLLGLFCYLFLNSVITSNLNETDIVFKILKNVYIYFGLIYFIILDLFFMICSNYPEYPFMLFACIIILEITIFKIPFAYFCVFISCISAIIGPYIHYILGFNFLIIGFIYLVIMLLVAYISSKYSDNNIRQSLLSQKDNNNLAYELIQKTKKLEKQLDRTHYIQDKTIINLANLIENRDFDTGCHIKRTQELVEKIIYALKENHIYDDILTDEYCRLTIKAAPLHDIGKISISDIILNAPRKLTDSEFEIIKTHTTKGAKLAGDVLEDIEEEKYIKMTKEIVLYHHERWDGKGYPCNLKGTEIPLCARIMSIADVYDALTQERCYKSAFSKEKAIEIMKDGSGTQFDPIILAIFFSKVI